MQRPAIVDDFEIDLIKRFLTGFGNVVIERSGMDTNYGFNALKERSTKPIFLKNDRISATLPSLGYIMFVENNESSFSPESLKKIELMVDVNFKYANIYENQSHY